KGRAIGGWRAGIESAEILEQIGHAGEWSSRQAVCEGLASLRVHPMDDGIDCGIARLDAGDRGVEQFRRADLALPHQRRKAKPIVAIEIQRCRHGHSSSIRRALPILLYPASPSDLTRPPNLRRARRCAPTPDACPTGTAECRGRY